MAMFDTVRVECPKCHETTTFQSKAGKAELMVFQADHVPTSIAADLNGKTDVCDNCDTNLVCQSSIPIYGRVWAEEYERE